MADVIGVSVLPLAMIMVTVVAMNHKTNHDVSFQMKITIKI